jgi:hypothetical protein
LLGASGALLTQESVSVLGFTVHFVSFGDDLCSISHHHVESRNFLQQSEVRIVVSRDHRNTLHPAAKCSIDSLIDDLMSGHSNRLQTGGAETVDGRASN